MNKYQELLKITIPAVLESMVTVIISTIDTQMISVLGSNAISAISFTTQPRLIFLSIFFALGTTVSMFVAQAYGRKDKNEANSCFILVLKISLILSVVLGILLYVFADEIMLLCNRQKSTLELSVIYFKIIMGAMIFQTTLTILNAALRGIGNTRVTLISNIALGLIDIVFNYLLIEGHFGFPALGVAGDAIATVMGTIAACMVSLYVLVSHSDFLSLKGFFNTRFKEYRALLSDIYQKAGNTVIENVMMRVGFLVSSVIVSLMNPTDTALYSVGMIVLNYSFAFGDGMQSGVLALTGRSMGEKNYRDLREYIRVAMITGIVCAILLTVIYLLSARWFFGLYFDDEYSKGAGVVIAGIVAGITLFQMTRMVNVGAIRGMGDSRIPKRIAIISTLFISPAVAYLLAVLLDFQIWGIWAAAFVTQSVWSMLAFVSRKKLTNQLE